MWFDSPPRMGTRLRRSRGPPVWSRPAIPSSTREVGKGVLPKLFLVVLAVAWIVVLVPPVLRARSESRNRGDSIGDFQNRLGVLESFALAPQFSALTARPPVHHKATSAPCPDSRPRSARARRCDERTREWPRRPPGTRARRRARFPVRSHPYATPRPSARRAGVAKS